MTDPTPYNMPPTSKPTKPAKSEQPKTREPLAPKVSSGQVVVRKPSLGKRIASTFTGDDIHSIGNYVLMDVIIPACKDLLFDVINQGSSRALFGESRSRGRTISRGGGGGVYTAYNAVSSAAKSVTAASAAPTQVALTHRERSSHDFGNIIFDNRGTAEEVLDTLRERIKEFDVATVADFYDLVDISSDFPDVKFGWTNATIGQVVRVSGGGYALDLPQPVNLND